MSTPVPRQTSASVPISDAEKIRALPWSIASSVLIGTVFGVWTVFGSAFLLYLRALGISKGRIGILLSLFPFCGLIAPFVAPVLARLGAKRVCVAAYGGRNLVIALLLLLPFVTAAGGQAGAFVFVTLVLFVFAILRALAETAMNPWSQQMAPDFVRGRFTAAGNIVGSLASVGAVALAGYVVTHGSGLGRFMWLQGAGCAAGLIGALLLLRIPGGAPAPPATTESAHWAEVKDALRDKNFRRFLYGTGSLIVAGVPAATFGALLLADKVGIQPGTVIWLDGAALIGSLATSFLWGWMADRFGSRTVLMPGLTLGLAVAVVWCAIATTGLGAVLGVAGIAALNLAGGIAGSATGIGSSRLLVVGVVPPERRVAYTAILYSWAGLVGGVSTLLAGGILSAVAGLRRHADLAIADPYAVLFTLSLIPAVLCWVFFAKTRPDGAARTRELIEQVVRQVFPFTVLTRWTNADRS